VPNRLLSLEAVVLLFPFAPAAPAFARPALGEGPARSVDAELVRMGREIPGFGGLFYDEQGRPNVYLLHNSATTMTSVACCNLAISKTVDVTTAMPGQTLHYTVVASNPSSEDAAATVDDSFPIGLTKVRWCRDTTPIPCTPNIPGDIHKPISLPAGGSATYRAQGIVDIKFTGTLSNTASVTAPDFTGASATDKTEISFTGIKAFCTGINGQLMMGSMITKTFVLINGGPANQADNPGDEFTDTLPAGLTLTGVSADSGTTAMVGNMATWNGAIPVGGMVMITITATITAPAGTTICNQAAIFFDADGDGINESNALSDDPKMPGDADPCCFQVIPPGIPGLSVAGLAALALLLAGLAVLRLRGRRRRAGAGPG
jgi:uncharacterized repeat protein (TIGR01451 family)